MTNLKNIWKVKTNNGDFIIVKAKQWQLESLYKQNKIKEYTDFNLIDITKGYFKDVVL